MLYRLSYPGVCNWVKKRNYGVRWEFEPANLQLYPSCNAVYMKTEFWLIPEAKSCVLYVRTVYMSNGSIDYISYARKNQYSSKLKHTTCLLHRLGNLAFKAQPSKRSARCYLVYPSSQQMASSVIRRCLEHWYPTFFFRVPAVSPSTLYPQSFVYNSNYTVYNLHLK
jgi:hypothetical protein